MKTIAYSFHNKKRKEEKRMEMQNVLAQLAGTIATNITEISSVKKITESKTNLNFENCMKGAIKQNDSVTQKSEKNSMRLSKKQQGMEDATSVNHASISNVNDEPVVKKEQLVRNEQLQNEPQEDVEGNSVNFAEMVISSETESNLFIQTKEVVEIATEWETEIKEYLCEEFELTPEELDDIMAELGMQFFELQNVNNVQQFMLVVSGEIDQAAFLTNENLSIHTNQIVETVGQITKVIAEEYDMTTKDVEEYLEQYSNVGMELLGEADGNHQNAEIPKQTEMITEQVVVKEDALQTNELVKEAGNGQNNIQQINENPFKMENNREENQNIRTITDLNETEVDVIPTDENVEVIEYLNNVVQENEKTLVNESEKINAKVVNLDNGKNSFEPKIEITVGHSEETKDVKLEEKETSSSSSNENKEGQSLFEHFIDNLSIHRQVQVEQTEMKLDAIAQMREIVTQVVEQIKVQVHADTTEMEVQLNPENLGKVNLTVVAKEGHITAQFVTENEMARQALEGQIQQLRDTLGEQGLKVEQVEVTVSNFDFANSNQANAEEQKQQHNQEQRKIQRSINLNDSIDLNELSEEEQLAARIMTENGNQVDYTA